MTADWLSAAWPWVAGLFGGIAGYATLRNQVENLKERQAKTEGMQEAMNLRIFDKLSSLETTLARVEGQLSTMKNKED